MKNMAYRKIRTLCCKQFVEISDSSAEISDVCMFKVQSGMVSEYDISKIRK